MSLAADQRPLMLVVAACLIDARGRVLLSQRPEGKSMAGGWEFPGGKARLPGAGPCCRPRRADRGTY